MQQRQKTHSVNKKNRQKWKLLERNNHILMISHQNGCWNDHWLHSNITHVKLMLLMDADQIFGDLISNFTETPQFNVLHVALKK